MLASCAGFCTPCVTSTSINEPLGWRPNAPRWQLDEDSTNQPECFSSSSSTYCSATCPAGSSRLKLPRCSRSRRAACKLVPDRPGFLLRTTLNALRTLRWIQVRFSPRWCVKLRTHVGLCSVCVCVRACVRAWLSRIELWNKSSDFKETTQLHTFYCHGL